MYLEVYVYCDVAYNVLHVRSLGFGCAEFAIIWGAVNCCHANCVRVRVVTAVRVEHCKDPVD